MSDQALQHPPAGGESERADLAFSLLSASEQTRLAAILDHAIASLAADGGAIHVTGTEGGVLAQGQMPALPPGFPPEAEAWQRLDGGTLASAGFGGAEGITGHVILWFAGERLPERARIGFFAALAGDLVAAAWARQELIAERARSDQAGRTKDEFLSTMSHELRTPLNAILGFSEVLRDQLLGPLGSATYVGYAGDIHRAGSYLLALINDLLDLSKIEAGKYEVMMRAINLTGLVDDTVKVVETLAAKKSITLNMDLKTDLCLGDERAIQQILVNLLSNSIKFSEPETTIQIESWTTSANQVALSVVDSGIGMTPEEVAVALKPFGQLHSKKAKSNQQGTGLGLPLVQRLAHLMGGSMEIESEKNIGTRITILLPAFMPILFR